MEKTHPDIKIIKDALAEDIGSGDVTTDSLIPENARAEAAIIFKEKGVLAGIHLAELVFKTLNKNIKFKSLAKDGTLVKKGQKVALISGSLRAILTGERTALNFIQHLSGIATKTAGLIKKVKGAKTKILDTRKTIPGLRKLEKHAVKSGGGTNHRMGLFDAVLIKNNHLKFHSIKDAVAIAGKKAPNLIVEVEVENLPQLKEALASGADIIMLDNMDNRSIKKALEIAKGKALIEVSGKVSPARIPVLSRMGVDFISIGALTHSAKALDISLKILKIYGKK